ncbi:MAG: ATP-binding protein [Kiritimatiellae bacterium]|nr:ATP-binding protein [Kiritimatiellia bacterium]
MYKRTIAPKLLDYSFRYPVLAVTGPRQSGKTTLCRALFPTLPHVNLESPLERDWALSDPVGFLGRHPKGALLDEVHAAPGLLPAVLEAVCAAGSNRSARYVLVSSRGLPDYPAALAERTAFADLLPFSLAEAYPDAPPPGLWETLWRGFYPAVHAHSAPPAETLSFHVLGPLERDARDLLAVRHPDAFFRFLRLAAGRTARPVNASNLAADVGVTPKTALDWLDLLEACHVIRRLAPWQGRARRRLAKTPKLHFLDTGLACALLGIRSPEDLSTHPLRGALFESFVVAEAWKRLGTGPAAPPLRHYRDSALREIDLVFDRPAAPFLVDAKSAETPSTDWLPALAEAAAAFPAEPPPKLAVVYAADAAGPAPDPRLIPWRQWPAAIPG